ncbi:PAS domain S-box-containing protein [Georgenia soli]|uniref:PAS domain S-box-containing protein n=1 Tax=Georgenia soli TaxID=638953 RepID=A0A2A9EJ03_9MICO|nr:SpoIIE family protein phosphatase [Georgenia soli]PFG39057.1 PAS domain S-box-containing protein [Georgenia soli]
MADHPDERAGGRDGGTATTPHQLAAAGVGTYEVDLGTRRLSTDASAREIFGADSVTELEQRVHPDDLPPLRDVLNGMLGDEPEYDLRFRVRDGDGTVRWAATHGRLQRDPDGAPSRLIGVVFAATPVREEYLPDAAFLETVPAAFMALSHFWRFTYVNTAAERVLGRTREELLGHELWELFPALVGSEFEHQYRRAMTTGHPVAFDAFYAPLDAWYEVRAALGPHGLSVYILDVTTRHALQEHTERAARRTQLTARLMTELVGTLNVQETASRIARTVVPELGDWGVVSVAGLDDVGGLRGMADVGWWHPDPARRPLVERYAHHRQEALRDDSFLNRALASGEVVSVPADAVARIQQAMAPGPARELIAELAPASATMLPLRSRGRTLGAISLFNGPGRTPLGGADLETAREIADRAALVLDNAYLYQRQRQVAEELQLSLLTDPPVLDHLDVAVRYVPAAEAAKVGGDWYDVFAPGRDATVVIGDVTGHDLHAAAFMGQIRSLLRGIAVTTGSGPADLLAEVDRALHALGHTTPASGVVAQLDAHTQPVRVRWSNAGHPPPMLVRPDGAVEMLAGSNLLLGVRPGTQRSESALTLEPGATLLLYTDGLVERRDGGLLAGVRRLRGVLAEVGALGVEELCDALLATLLPDQPDDDVALVVIRPR